MSGSSPRKLVENRDKDPAPPPPSYTTLPSRRPLLHGSYHDRFEMSFSLIFVFLLVFLSPRPLSSLSLPRHVFPPPRPRPRVCLRIAHGTDVGCRGLCQVAVQLHLCGKEVTEKRRRKATEKAIEKQSRSEGEAHVRVRNSR